MSTIGRLEARTDLLDRLELVRAWLGRRLAVTQRELVNAIGIIDRGIFEVRQVISNDGFLLSLADLLSVRADAVGGRDQKSMVDPLAVRLAEELIDVRFGDFVIGRVALRLNGPCLPVLVLEDEIDSAVPTPSIWILVPQPYLRDLRRPLWVDGQEPFYESLELPAPLDRIRVEDWKSREKDAIPSEKPRFFGDVYPLILSSIVFSRLGACRQEGLPASASPLGLGKISRGEKRSSPPRLPQAQRVDPFHIHHCDHCPLSLTSSGAPPPIGGADLFEASNYRGQTDASKRRTIPTNAAFQTSERSNGTPAAYSRR